MECSHLISAGYHVLLVRTEWRLLFFYPPFMVAMILDKEARV